MNAPMRISILSSRTASSDHQIKPAGKIRPGIKVLTNQARKDPRAVDIYNKGVAQRLKFTEIEKSIADKTGIARSMYPRNTSYFNVASSDFGMPEIADHIVEKYGEMRDGDNQKYLYRFPVVFHSDDLNEVYPNSFRRHGGDPGYESHYGEDGVRYCRYLPEITADMVKDAKIRRIKKMPRREKVIRGQCQPIVCPEFQQGQCKFRGRLLFYIPGVPTTGMLVMETSSEYAAEAIWSDLERIRDALGTLPRVNPNKPGAPIFWITKVQATRTYFDEEGKKCSGLQWVPTLQADIDIGALLASGSVQSLPSPSTPIGWLKAPIAMPDAPTLPPAQAVVDVDQVEAEEAKGDPTERFHALVASLGVDQDAVMEYFDIKIAQSWENDPTHVETAINMLNDLSRFGDACIRKLIVIAVTVHKLGIGFAEFNAYALAKYGRGFSGKENVMSAIETEVATWTHRPPAEIQQLLMAGAAQAA